MKYALVGAGNIGMLYDFNQKKEGYSYYSTIKNLKGHKIVAICEKKRIKTRLENHIKIYNKFNLMLKNEKFDTLIIASSSESHYKLIKSALKFKVKYIICEKPFRFSLIKRSEILNLLKKNQRVLINFSRRFSGSYIDLKKRLKKNEFGALRFVKVFFTRGVINNGCHYIDLLRYILNSNCVVKNVNLKKSKIINKDYSGKMSLSFNKIIAYFYAKDRKHFNEKIMLYFKNYKIEISNNEKMSIFKRKKSQNFFYLKKSENINREKQIKNMLLSLKNKVNKSSIKNAFETNDLLDKILRKNY